VRIAGAALNPDASSFEGTVALNPSYRSGTVAVGMLRSTRAKADGTFEFENVMPGEYVLQAARANVNKATEGPFASQFVTVTDTDVTGIVIRPSPGSTIAGRVLFEGIGDFKPGDFELSPVPADGDSVRLTQDPPARAEIHDDWTFEMAGIHGSRRLRLLQASARWALKAILADGTDVTDTPLVFGTTEQSLRDVQVVLTDRVSGITGVVVDDRGRAVHHYTIIAFAVDRTLRYKHSRFVAHGEPDRDGAFALRRVAPGEYYVAAINPRRLTDLNEALEDADLLNALVSTAAKLRLAEGETHAVSLPMTPR
jgi:hypothetical protein